MSYSTYIRTNTESLDFPDGVLDRDISIFADGPWKILIWAGEEFITVFPPQGEADRTITVSVTPTDVYRVGAIRFYLTEDDSIYVDVGIKQGTLPAEIDISTISWEPTHAASTLSVDITTNAGWISTMPSGWPYLSLSPSSGGASGSTILSITANTTSAARTGVIRFHNSVDTLVYKEIRVIQAAYPAIPGDNGLPPAGTDVTGNSVNGADISSSDADTGTENKVEGVAFGAEKTGNNWGTFL